MPKPSATSEPAKSRAKAEKEVATAKVKAKPKKKVRIKGPHRSKRGREQPLDTESSDSEINDGLAKRTRKSIMRRQGKASEDTNWANGYSC